MISTKSQSKWGRIGKIILILIVFYISIVIVFEFFHIYGEGVWIPAYFNPIIIILSLTVGYFASMLLNLVKRRFLSAGILFVFWGLFSVFIGQVNEEFQHLGIILICTGLVFIIAPLLLRNGFNVLIKIH